MGFLDNPEWIPSNLSGSSGRGTRLIEGPSNWRHMITIKGLTVNGSELHRDPRIPHHQALHRQLTEESALFGRIAYVQSTPTLQPTHPNWRISQFKSRMSPKCPVCVMFTYNSQQARVVCVSARKSARNASPSASRTRPLTLWPIACRRMQTISLFFNYPGLS